MSKKQSVAISIILLLLMASAGLTTISIPAVKAYNYEDWAYSSNLYTTNWQYNGEAQAASTAFGQIANLFAQKTVYYYGYPYGPTYGEVQNWGSSETPSNVYGQITYDIAHHPGFSTVLYVGHGGPDGFYCHTAYPDDQNTLPDAVEFNSYLPQCNPIRPLTFNLLSCGYAWAAKTLLKALLPLGILSGGVIHPLIRHIHG
jgi:hypothetical protein